MNWKALKASVLEIAVFILILVVLGVVFTATYTVFNIYISPYAGLGFIGLIIVTSILFIVWSRYKELR